MLPRTLQKSNRLERKKPALTEGGRHGQARQRPERLIARNKAMRYGRGPDSRVLSRHAQYRIRSQG